MKRKTGEKAKEPSLEAPAECTEPRLKPCPAGHPPDGPYQRGNSRRKNVLWHVWCSDPLCKWQWVARSETEVIDGWNTRG